MRPTKDEYMMHLAHVARSRSTCTKPPTAPFGVGCVIASTDGKVLATGYSGSPNGQPHCTDVGHQLVDGRCIRTVHAEQNAVAQAVRHGTSLLCTIAYVTNHPCMDCAKLLAAAGVTRVVYLEDYRPEIDEITRGLVPMMFERFSGRPVWLIPHITPSLVPVFIIEGIDGAGKSSVVNHIEQEFPDPDLLIVREPGGTNFGDSMRLALTAYKGVCPKAMTLTFAAARAQLMHQVVGPAISTGRPVLFDRSFISSMVYQGGGTTEGMLSVMRVNADILEASRAWPTDIILLDVVPSIAMKRSKGGDDPGGYDAEGEEKHAERRARYNKACALVKAECGCALHIVDASQSMQYVNDQVTNIVKARLTADSQA